MEATDQNGPRLLNAITPRNLLSFGPDNEPLELNGLNVLLGPNGSGKSNLLEAIALLRTCPNREGFRPVIARGGGIGEWIWKVRPDEPASVEALVARPDGQPLRHHVALRKEQQSFRLEDERIENERPAKGERKPYLFYHYGHGRPVINTVIGKTGRKERQLNRDDVAPDASILAQRQDPERFPEITRLATVYDRIRLYREWAFGRNTVFREPQKSDLRNDRLEEDFSNLGMFLNRLRRQPKTKASLLAGLADLYEGLADFDVSVEGGTVQVFFTEGDFSIPATRLSDGTIRYLCLLAILCDPEPPPLIGIEEPELGLHPDILPKIADLLMATSERTQLIVTTHSEILVDALTERPGAVVVCEKHEGQTTMRRPDPDALAVWLEKHRLGRLWMDGQLGGTRW
ncbi:MAG: AAA family ATPase [Isosphaeraceae bacterium]